MKSNLNKKPGKRGGRRPGSGRKAGTPNKATRELKELASEYTERAVKTLAEVMEDPGAPPAARVAAADKLLDRGYGRPAVTVDANVNNKLDQDLMHRLETEFVERMAKARERQRQVLIERGFIDKDGNKLRD
jgi:predicted Zn-dependent protease